MRAWRLRGGDSRGGVEESREGLEGEGSDSGLKGEIAGTQGWGERPESNELVPPRGAACQIGSLTRPGLERRMTQ